MNTTNPNAPSSEPGALSQEDRNWGMIAHLAAFAGCVVPFGSILGPLIVYLTKKDQSPFAGECAKESLNFNITAAIGFVICIALWLVFIGILLTAALGITWLVLTIIATVKANEGTVYRYPVNIRFVK